MQFSLPLFPRLCKVCLETHHSCSVCCLFPFPPLPLHAPFSAVGLAWLTTISATECEGQEQRVKSCPIHILMDWDPFIGFSAGWCPEMLGSCQSILITEGINSVPPLCPDNLLHENQLLSRLLFFCQTCLNSAQGLKIHAEEKQTCTFKSS